MQLAHAARAASSQHSMDTASLYCIFMSWRATMSIILIGTEISALITPLFSSKMPEYHNTRHFTVHNIMLISHRSCTFPVFSWTYVNRFLPDSRLKLTCKVFYNTHLLKFGSFLHISTENCDGPGCKTCPILFDKRQRRGYIEYLKSM